MLASIVLIYIVTLFVSMASIHSMPAASPTLEIIAPIPGATWAPRLTERPQFSKVAPLDRHPLKGIDSKEWAHIWQARKALGLQGVNKAPNPMEAFLRSAPRPQARMQYNPLTRSYV